MSSYYPLEIPRCEHIKDNGVRCGAPALRGRQLCYHHNDVHAKRLKPGHKGYKFRPIETAESVTMQVADIAQAAHDGTISLPLARVLLYAIQIGAQQMKKLGVRCDLVETEVTPAMQIGSADHLNIGSSEEEIPVVCHPERGRTAEPKDPISADATTNAPTLSHREPITTNVTTTADVPMTRSSDGRMKKRPRYYDPEGCLAFLSKEG